MTDLKGHVTEAGVDRLLVQLQDKPRVLALLLSCLRGTQVAADSAAALRRMRDIERAVGVHLDRLGAIVGQPRQGRDDGRYRRMIEVRRLINEASGTIPQIREILGRIAGSDGDGSGLEITTHYPAALRVRAVDPQPVEGDVLAGVLSEIRAGGVESHMEWRTEADYFGFAGDDSPNRKGFGEGQFVYGQKA